MSDLRRTLAKSPLADIRPPPAIFDEREEEGEKEDEDERKDHHYQGTDEAKEREENEDHFDGDDDNDEKQLLRPMGSPTSSSSSSASSTGTIVPSPSRHLFERPKASTGARSRSGPLSWTEFFAQALFFDRRIDDIQIQHHVYLTPPTGSGPLFVTHHGAGSSGLSFANFTREIQKILPNAGVLSLDARGHGETQILPAANPESTATAALDLDLSLATLSQDLAFVVQSTLPRLPQDTPPPPIILIGHSLGGAVITNVASSQLLQPFTTVLGHIVLDVVEGSAMDALQSMELYLSTRPKAFTSVASGIEWHTRSRTIRNVISARVSVPSLLRAFEDEEGVQLWHWRTDLAATKPFWEDWFVGLSTKFLAAPGGKMLILAGTDRLDKTLMIGQMQGKYALQVFPDAGHFVHEDQPAKAAMVVADFYRRNDRSTLVLPPKVDELIRMGKLGNKKV